MTTKKSSEKTLVLLDAHAILHRAYHALPDFASPSGEPTGALYGVVAMLLKIVEELKPDYVVACYDLPQPTYRHDAYAGYKATRTKTDETLVAQIERSRDIFAVFQIPIYEHVGFEADDLLGTIAEQTRDTKDLKVVIASGDMDTLQLIEKKRVQVYTLKKGIKDTILYDEKAVKERFGFGPTLIPDYKGLRGDPSDNIPGVAGIGDKGATVLITSFGSLDALFKALKKSDEPFLAAGIKPRIIQLLKDNEEEAQFSKMLAVIRRDCPVTFTLPAETWPQAVDPEAVLSLFSELGFRTLAGRIRTLLDVPADVLAAAPQDPKTKAAVLAASIKLWLLESDRTNANYEDLIDYGRTYFDTSDIAEIEVALTKKLEDANLISLYETIEKPLTPVIDLMQKNGIALDVAYLKTLSTQFHIELTALEKDIYAHAGKEFNINSPKQLGEILFDTLELKPKNAKKTATGQRSTKESELEKMQDDHEIIPAVLRYRELQKLVSTYVDSLPNMVASDGRVHSTFLQTGTTTGRMASKDPNLQNIPMKTEEGRAIRKAFVAGKGRKLVAIDYSQVELRIAAIMAKDAGLIDIFKRGEDVHTGVAVRVFGVEPGEVTSEMRRKAKVINFGILYGMGVNALRQNLGGETSREEAQEFLNAYFNTFTRLAEYLEETKAEARTHGYTTTLFSRRRHFPGIQSGAPFIRAAAERMAINAPIQGTAADIVRVAMLRVSEYLVREKLTAKVQILLQVHDELVFEIDDDCIEEVVPRLVGLMEGVLSDKEDFGVPVKAEVKVGPNWQEMKDWQPPTA